MRGSAWSPAPTWLASSPQKRRHVMGDKRSKKDKNKADKQKQEQQKKKEEQQKNKQPVKQIT
jgi:hypothetical protein